VYVGPKPAVARAIDSLLAHSIRPTRSPRVELQGVYWNSSARFTIRPRAIGRATIFRIDGNQRYRWIRNQR
jgi:hypothetical protein